MKRCLLPLLLLAIMMSSMVGSPTVQAQQPSVAFVTGHEEGGYRLNDLSGFSRLSGLINDAGGLVQEITLDQPIPDTIDVVVLGGPKRPSVSIDEISRIWSYLEQGGSLLILNDPLPNNGLPAGSALNRLLWQDYGIRWHNDAILEKWFTPDIAHTVTRRGYRFQPRRVVGISANPIPGHPITDFAANYSLGVFYWLSRSLDVQGPALRGDPVPLLASRTSLFGDTPFGEVTMERWQPAFSEAGQAELSIGEDAVGQLIIGAAVEDRETGARIAVFGDSDLFKNGYGLEYSPGTDWPLFSGNDFIAQSTVRWLLKLPQDDIQWARGHAWIAIDDDDQDWNDIDPYVLDSDTISSVKMARTDRANYFLLPMRESATSVRAIHINGIDASDAPFSISIEGNLNIARVQFDDGPIQILLIDTAVGDSIELRLPINALPVNELYRIVEICLTLDATDCAETNITRPNRLGLEPRGYGLIPSVPTARINQLGGDTLLFEPYGAPLADIEAGVIVNVFEFSEDGIWARVRAENLEGWLPTVALHLAFDAPVQ